MKRTSFLGVSSKRQWHPTSVLLPGESHGRRSLVGCSPWGHWESDRTERLHFDFSLSCIGEGKGGLKLNIQKTKIMASGPITSWQIDGETVTDCILGGSKITADFDCSHEIKRHLLLGRKVMTNLDSILKSRDITLPTKVHLAKAVDQ